jgi:hypothetical protein
VLTAGGEDQGAALEGRAPVVAAVEGSGGNYELSVGAINERLRGNPSAARGVPAQATRPASGATAWGTAWRAPAPKNTLDAAGPNEVGASTPHGVLSLALALAHSANHAVAPLAGLVAGRPPPRQSARPPKREPEPHLGEQLQTNPLVIAMDGPFDQGPPQLANADGLSVSGLAATLSNARR